MHGFIEHCRFNKVHLMELTKHVKHDVKYDETRENSAQS